MTTIPEGHICGHHDTNPAIAETVADATGFWNQYKPNFPTATDARRRLRIMVAFARREGATWQAIADSFECDPKTLRDHIGCIPRFGKKKPANERGRGVASGGQRRHLLEHEDDQHCNHDDGCQSQGECERRRECRGTGHCHRHQEA